MRQAETPLHRRGLGASSCALATSTWGLLTLVSVGALDRLTIEFGPMPGESDVVSSIVQALLVISVALAVVGYHRLAGISGLAWTVASLVVLLVGYRLFSGLALSADARWLAFHLVPTFCFGQMIVTPRRTRPDARRLALPFGAMLLGAVAAPDFFVPELLGLHGLADVLILFVAVVGVLSLASAPWRPIALALALIPFGMRAIVFELTSSFETHEYLLIALTTLLPAMLLATAVVRSPSARRRLAS